MDLLIRRTVLQTINQLKTSTPVTMQQNCDFQKFFNNFQFLPFQSKNLCSFACIFDQKIKRQLASFKIGLTEKLSNLIEDFDTESCVLKNIEIYGKILIQICKVASSLNLIALKQLCQTILSLYSHFIELRQHVRQTSSQQILQKSITCSLEDMERLLRSYFCFQQCSESQLFIELTDAQIFCQEIEESLTNNVLAIRQQTNYQSFFTQNKKKINQGFQRVRQIQQKVNSMSLEELFERVIRKQEKELRQKEEICRICSQAIRLQNMEQHVSLCQRKSIFKQETQQKQNQIQKCLKELQVVYQKVCEQPWRDLKQQSFIRTARKILATRTIKKCSQGVLKSERNIKHSIETVIEQHEEEFGQHELLSKIRLLFMEKNFLQTKCSRIEVRFDLKQNNQSRSQKNHLKTNNRRVSLTLQETQQALKYSNYSGCEYTASSDYLSRNRITFKQLINSSSKIKSLGRMNKKFSAGEAFSDINLPIKQYSSMKQIVQSQEQPSISLQNFQILKFLGQGAFGKVYMVRRKQTKDIYAMKLVKIKENYDKNDLETIKNQHQIFKKIAGPHLVKAPFSFHQQNCQIFILQYLPGGDLRKMLDDEVYLQADKARFYLAEIILAIQHLHKYSIIHRDLKPQNLVFDKSGHLKLTDFGLSDLRIQQKLKQSLRMEQQAKCIKRKLKRRAGGIWGNKNTVKLIGTPDYIAPEIISQISNNNQTIDWWSLGVIAYQLMIGARPFGADSIQQVIDNITKFNIVWPQVGYEQDMITPEAKDLIQQLLNNNFAKRLGANGADQIKKHPFFKGIDWQHLKSSQPPIIPQVRSNFQNDKLVEDPCLRKQLMQLLDGKKLKNFDLQLQRFVRFDLLGTQSIQNAEKIYERESDRISMLKTQSKRSLGMLQQDD